MNLMKNFLLILTSFISIVFSAVLFLDYQETSKNHFADYEEMKSSGLMEKGWIPRYIPHSAIDIYEQHNIDSNRVHLYFKYNPNDAEQPGKECMLLAKNEKGLKFICHPNEGSTSILVLRKDGVGYYDSVTDGLHMPIIPSSQ